MKREVSYQWRLREVMAAHGMFTVTELVPLLHDRGIGLSASPGTPAGLRHAGTAVAGGPGGAVRHLRLHPGRADRHQGQDATVRKAATGDGVVNLNARRPKRARLRPEG